MIYQACAYLQFQNNSTLPLTTGGHANTTQGSPLPPPTHTPEFNFSDAHCGDLDVLMGPGELDTGINPAMD